jgi:glycosyltransferase involved in cell wall biosynthesis
VFGTTGYFYAREFTKNFLKIEIEIMGDDPVVMLEADVFLGLDLCLSDLYEQRRWLTQAQQRGALLYVVAYDLLPATHPQWFPVMEHPIFINWLKTIAEFDGIISISEATSSELKDWLRQNPRLREQPLKFNVIHIGSDISHSNPSKGLPMGYEKILGKLTSEITFLMVGTIEPRKGHVQVVDAFELLWAAGHPCQLVIVGKPGWNVAQLIERINSHTENGSRLFWFEVCSDELLERLYKSCSCLLAASEAEGFGLPIIEASHYGLPILARDIAVFREVANNSATYFIANSGLKLSGHIKNWIERYQVNNFIKSNDLECLSWNECCNQFKEVIEQSAQN